jgi:hypothetical protein
MYCQVPNYIYLYIYLFSLWFWGDICSSVDKCLFSSCHETGALVPANVCRRLECLIKREGLRQTWCQRICYWWYPYTLCFWYTFIGYCWYKGQVNYNQNHWSITGVESVIRVECFMSSLCGCCEFRYSQIRIVTRFSVMKVSNHQVVSATPKTIICCHKLNTVISTH